MINKFYKVILLFFLIFCSHALIANELDIKSNTIELDKSKNTVIASGSVEVIDSENNIINSEKIKYDKTNKVLNTFGQTEILTSEKFKIKGENLY